MDYSTKIKPQHQILFFGIWNIPGIFQNKAPQPNFIFFKYGLFRNTQKKNDHNQNFIFLEYGIFRNIPNFPKSKFRYRKRGFDVILNFHENTHTQYVFFS